MSALRRVAAAALPALAAPLLALATPAPAVVPLGAPAAVAPLPVTPVTLYTATGRHRYTAEVARTPAEQARGLMFRTRMARDRGMIFPLPTPRPASFWMENTPLSLDIIFIGPDNRVLNVAARTTPFSRDFVDSAGPVGAVLELNAGEAARIGLKPGDRLAWRFP